MAIDALVRPLLGLQIFQGLKPLQITEIVRRADRIVYRPGDMIICEDSQGDAAVVIIAGNAVRVSGPALLADHEEAIPAGALLGEMAMLIETEHSSTVVARSLVRGLRISRAEIHAQMAEDNALADHFMRRITGRLSAILDELRGIDQSLEKSQVALPIPAHGMSTAEHPGPALH